MKKYLFLPTLILLTILSLTLTTTYSDPEPNIEGTWNIEGKTNKGVAYMGEVRIYKRHGELRVAGYYLTDPGAERLLTYNSKAKFKRNGIDWKFFITQTPGVLNILSDLGAEMRSSRRLAIGSALRNGNDKWNVNWSCSKLNLKGKETWTRELGDMEITSVDPAKIETKVGDYEDKVLTIKGKNLPSKDEIETSSISFLLKGKKDKNIKVREILETADDRTFIKIRTGIGSTTEKIVPGKRDVKIGETTGKELFEISLLQERKKLPLGGTISATTFDKVRLFIPNQDGGTLELTGPEGMKLHKDSPDGEEIKKSEDGKYEVPGYGWYYVNLKEADFDFKTTLEAKYRITGETPKAKKPWNFWYFPFVQRYRKGQNLYKDGETYEKLDKVLAIKAKKDGWKDFRPYRHMDDEDKDSRVQKLAKKYYKNGTWKTPEDEDDLEFLKRHNPSTMKGYAWCYQRSKDSDKGWWGHCWGAVVASSLYSQPEEKTLTGPNGEKFTFSQEEAEGILTSYFTNHSIYPTNYMRNCPAGRPTEKKEEDVDNYPDDFLLGLIKGIKKDGLPLASNIRAESTSESKSSQVWNHVIWKFEADVKEVEKKDDETYVEVKLKIYATSDIYPSYDSKGSREETYTFRLKYTSYGSIDRDNLEYQNWISATHFAPSYLWRIKRSAESDGTENKVLRGRIKKLVELFDYKRIK